MSNHNFERLFEDLERVQDGPQGPCLSHVVIQDYVGGNMSRREHKDALAHFESCKACADAADEILHPKPRQWDLSQNDRLLVLEALAAVDGACLFVKRLKKDTVVFEYVNDQFSKLLADCPPWEIIGKSDKDFNDDDSEVLHYEEIDREILAGLRRESVVNHETWQGIDLQTKKVGVELPSGEIVLVGVAKDISKVRRLESAVSELENRLVGTRDFLSKALEGDC